MAGAHGIQGIGAGFVPQVLDTNILSKIICAQDEDAFVTGRKLRDSGLLVGISSGAAAFAAGQLAKMPENKGKIVVTVFAGSGERDLSAGLFRQT